MARIRTIKPEFWESEKAGRLTPLARLTFLGLISLADDEGRGRAGIGFLLGRLHPYGREVDAMAMSQALQEIENIGLVSLYEGPDGCSYYFIPGFLDNQKIDKPSPSKLPPPSKKNSPKPRRSLAERSPKPRDHSPLYQVSGIRDQGEEGKSIAAEPPASPKKEPTPIQRIVMAYKESKSIEAKDTAWDKANFARYSKAAKSLLECFGNDHKAAMIYLLGQGEEWDQSKINWTLETIARHAWDNKGKFSEAANGPEHRPLDANRLLGPRGHSRTSSAGGLAGQTLEAIAGRAQEADRLGAEKLSGGDAAEICTQPFLAGGDDGGPEGERD